MGGRSYQCSFCRKPFRNGGAVADHERMCVMLEHGRIVPRDIPVVLQQPNHGCTSVSLIKPPKV